MFLSLPYKAKQFFFVLIKLSVVVSAFYFIYLKLLQNQNLNFDAFRLFLIKNDVFLLKNVFFLTILTVFNWFFEILKWQKLVSIMKAISFKKALEQSLGSLTASLFTPNRIGEYGAKAIYFIAPLRKQTVFLNLMGNIYQMGVTLIFGVTGFFIFIIEHDIEINLIKSILLLFIITLALMVIIFFTKKYPACFKRFSIEKTIKPLKALPANIHIHGMMFSFLRYAVFSFQFYYLLVLFGVDIPYVKAMTIISSMYLWTSVLPSIFIFDVFTKGSVAVFLFSIIGVNGFIILCIIMLMWLLNFVLPSIFGSFYVLNFNLPKNHSV